MESWSWIASVFTRPLNKAFLSVFLVFGIWDFGMVVVFFLFFFFLSLCIPPLPLPQVHFWFKLILPTPLPSDPQLFKKKEKKKESTVLLSIFFVLAAIPLSRSKVIFCHFWFMHADMHLCRLFHLFVKELLVCFPSEREAHVDITCY